jgi:hypothetical protein
MFLNRNFRILILLLISLLALVSLSKLHRLVRLPAPVDIYANVSLHLEAYVPPPDTERKEYHLWNERKMNGLLACVQLKMCEQNQLKVAILAAHWFQQAVVEGWRGGEGIW